MQMMIKGLLALWMVALTLQVGAQTHQARGMYTLSYKDQVGVFDRKEAPGPVKQKAREEAALRAVETYFAEAGQAQAANFDAVRGRILEQPQRYILETTVLSENDNPKDFQYTVVVRVSLNVAGLRNLMQASAAVAQTAAAEKSALSLVFISRQVDTVKRYDDRVYQRQDRSVQLSATRQEQEAATEKTREGESVRRAQVETHGSASREVTQGVRVTENASVSTETGGSTVSRASESTWRLLPSAHLNQVFSAEFTQAGYDVIDAAMVDAWAAREAEIQNDYRTGNDLQPATLRAATAAMREAQIPFLVLGTLDVGLPAKDPQTGLMRVSVTVTAKVWDLTRPIPRTRLAVDPIAYAGVGPSEDEARSSALRLAAGSAAKELAHRMAVIGLR